MRTRLCGRTSRTGTSKITGTTDLSFPYLLVVKFAAGDEALGTATQRLVTLPAGQDITYRMTNPQSATAVDTCTVESITPQ
jgi:hypothetical protein